MNSSKRILVGVAVFLLAAAGARGQGKKGSPFANLSKGHPTARKIVEGLVDDLDPFLDKLDKAMKARSDSASKTVNAWSSAVSKHSSAWRAGMNKAYGIMKKSKSSDSLPGTTPADWKVWSAHHAKFLSGVSSGQGYKAIVDYRELCRLWQMMLVQKKSMPEVKKGYRKEMQKVNDDIEDIMEKLAKADSAAKVKAQRRRFIRIWTTVNNVQYAHVKQQEGAKKFLGKDQHKPDKYKAKYEKFKKWCQSLEKDSLLEPRCAESLRRWRGEWSGVVLAYERTRKSVEKSVKPIVDGTLFDDIGIFSGVKFGDLKKTIEKYEKKLIAKEDEFGVK